MSDQLELETGESPVLTDEVRERRRQELLELPAEERVLYREQRIPEDAARRLGDDARADGEEDVPRFAISSAAEVERRTWWGDTWIEVLDHSPGAVRMERFEDTPPLYVEHDRRLQAGAWRNVELEDDVIRGDPIFSRSSLGQEIRMDVVDGIRNKTSVGYRVHDAILEEVRVVDEDDGRQVEVWRVTDWEPLEGSIVGVPADATVGAGRSDHGPQEPPDSRETGPEPASQARESTMGKGDQTAPGGAGDGTRDEGGTEVRTGPTAQDERQRVRGIYAIAQEHDAHDLAERAIEEEWSPGRMAQAVLERQKERGESTRTTPERPGQGPAIDLPRRERRRYSLTRAIAQAGGLEDPGLEAEVSRALEDNLPEGYKRQGKFLVPTAGIDLRVDSDDERVREVFDAERARAERSYRQRAGLDTETAGKGQEAVFTEYGGFLEMLRTRALVLTLGADFMPGLQGDVSFVKQTAAATAEWVQENPAGDVSDTEVTLALVTLDPKTLMGSTFFTRQLLRQNVISVDERAEDDLTAVHARAVDKAAIHGGGANEPSGVYQASGVNAVAFDGPITFGNVVDMETEVAADDADIGAMAYLTTPEVRGQAKQTEMFSGTSGRPIWTGPVQAGEMNGYRAAASNQVRKDLGAGSDEHGLAFGVWSQLMIGEWGVLDLIVDPFTKKKRGLIEVTSFQMVDIQLAYAEAFCKATGLTIPAS